ncbi:MAG: GntR family transcriptional regulator [Rhodothermales bacterium]
MLSIDRTSSSSIHEQLLAQLRFQIASGHYTVDEPLPSTRTMARRLDISFHTVRKVYQELEQDGIVASRPGSGFIVQQRVPLAKSERMERGAALVEETLKHLIGLGLSEGEIEYLFQEQSALLKGSGPGHKLVAVFPYREMADLCASQIEDVLQQPVLGASPADFTRHLDADFVFAPYALVQDVMAHLPRADVIGIITYLDQEALGRIARLLDDETLGVVTKYADSIQPLTSEIRSATSFSGQMLAASVDKSADHLAQFIDQTDLVVFTPPCRRRMLGLLRDRHQRLPIAPIVAEDSLKAIREALPG